MASATSVMNGQVGELATSSELLSRGHIVCGMLPGYPAIDLVTLDNGHNVRRLVQVKYEPTTKPSWLTTSAIERQIDSRLIYVFLCRAQASSVGFDYYCITEADTRTISTQQNAATVARRLQSDSGFVDNEMRRIDLTDPQYLAYKNNFSIF